MGAVVSEFPTRKGRTLTRGDQLDIPVTIKIEGVPQDVSGWTWRAQVRTFVDSPEVVFEFDVIDGDNPTEGEILLHAEPEDSALLASGMTFDLEQLTPVQRTLWIVTCLHVTKDISRDEPVP